MKLTGRRNESTLGIFKPGILRYPNDVSPLGLNNHNTRKTVPDNPRCKEVNLSNPIYDLELQEPKPIS